MSTFYESYIGTSEEERKEMLKIIGKDNIMDLFSISNCKYLVESPGSSWSYFAKTYRNLPSVRAYEIPDLIENHNESFTNTIKQVTEEIPLNMI